MKNGFDSSGFMEYLQCAFSGYGNLFLRSLLENIIEYGMEHEQASRDQFCYWISNLLPWISFGEVAAFMNDESLTAYGIQEKKEAIVRFGRR